VAEKTTIEITKRTRTALKVWKAKHEMTYDEAIMHLINQDETKTESTGKEDR